MNIKPFTPPLPLKDGRGIFNYMSTSTIYGLIRQLCEETGGPYLEIGSYRGMSLLAAGQDTKVKCYGIDNFTGTGHRAQNKPILLEQIEPYDNIELIEADYRDALPELKKKRKKFGVIFLDGPHGEEETAEQLEYASKMIKKGGYVIVDDLNFTEVAICVDRFMKGNSKFEIVLHETTKDRNDRTWWNGVCVIRKK